MTQHKACLHRAPPSGFTSYFKFYVLHSMCPALHRQDAAALVTVVIWILAANLRIIRHPTAYNTDVTYDIVGHDLHWQDAAAAALVRVTVVPAHRDDAHGRGVRVRVTQGCRSGCLRGLGSAIWILATYDVVRHVRCRTSCTYDIVRVTYDIVLYIARTMSYVRCTGSRRTTSYVRHRT